MRRRQSSAGTSITHRTGGYTRDLPEQTHCAAQRALEEIRSRIGAAASRGTVVELEQGADLAFLAARCHD
jgi:F420-0:gamma-glutamyl ligase-like protein